jgi:hypothetical protein
MSVMRRFVVSKFAAAAALVGLFGAAVYAQQADEEPVVESEEVEEIIVVAPKPGARRRVDKEYEDPAWTKLLKDLHKMQVDEEEYEWRKSAAVEKPSRIKWGYDPTDDYDMRNNLELEDEYWKNTNKPATLFRLEF